MLKNVKYVPDKLVPYTQNETAEARAARVRAYLGDYSYVCTQSGVTEINRLSRLLTYVQLTKSGALPISWWTMAKAALVPNYGPDPVGARTELEKVIAQVDERQPTFSKPPHIVNKPNEGRSTIATS